MKATISLLYVERLVGRFLVERCVWLLLVESFNRLEYYVRLVSIRLCTVAPDLAAKLWLSAVF